MTELSKAILTLERAGYRVAPPPDNDSKLADALGELYMVLGRIRELQSVGAQPRSDHVFMIHEIIQRFKAAFP
jgi:hypothetical protein